MGTEKLKVIKKLTLNMKKRVKKKEENDQQTENLQLFLETGNGPKNDERYRKKGQTDQQKKRIKFFFEKRETDPKSEETGPKKINR